MIKQCESCGYMYDDSVSSCPQCDAGKVAASQNSGVQDGANQTDTAKIPDITQTNSSRHSFADQTNTPFDTLNMPNNGTSYNKPSLVEKSFDLLKKHKKASIITISIIAGLILITILYFVIINAMPVTVDINDYIKYDIITDTTCEDLYADDYAYEFENSVNGPGLRVTGFDGHASIDVYDLYNIIDWESLVKDANKQLKRKRSFGGREMVFSDFFDLYSFSFALDKTTEYSNGDTVTVELAINQDRYINDVEFKMCEEDYTFEFTIEGLKEVEAINPFDYVNLIYIGADGKGTAEIVVDENLNKSTGLTGVNAVYARDTSIVLTKNGDNIAYFYFSLDDYYSNGSYSNGDSVVLNVSCSNDYLSEEYGIFTAAETKTYTVSGLGSFIETSTSFSDEEFAEYKAYSDSILAERFEGYDAYSDFAYETAYVTTYKDSENYKSFENAFTMIYSYNYTSYYGDVEKQYLYVTYRDLIVTDAGDLQNTPESFYYTNNYGYDSVEDVINSLYGADIYNIAEK